MYFSLYLRACLSKPVTTIQMDKMDRLTKIVSRLLIGNVLTVNVLRNLAGISFSSQRKFSVSIFGNSTLSIINRNAFQLWRGQASLKEKAVK